MESLYSVTVIVKYFTGILYYFGLLYYGTFPHFVPLLYLGFYIRENDRIDNLALRNVFGLRTHVKNAYLDTYILPIIILPKHEITSTMLQNTQQSTHTKQF